jgi:signal transduction histidine kinase/ligand-binding sensor domain-containing protein
VALSRAVFLLIAIACALPNVRALPEPALPTIVQGSGQRLSAPESVELLDAQSSLQGKMWTAADGLLGANPRRIVQDSRGYIWLAFWAGVVRFDGLHFQTFDRNTRPNILKDDCIGICEADGAVWAGTYGGLWEFRNGSWRIWGPRDGIDSAIASIAASRRGGLWVSDSHLRHLKDGVIKTWDVDGTVLMEDSQGRLLIQKGSKLCRFFPETGRLETICDVFPAAFKMSEASDHRIYFANGDLFVLDGNSAKKLAGWKPNLGIQDFCILPNGHLLLAAKEGLFEYAEGQLTRRTLKGDLRDNTLFSVVIDAEGYIWTGTLAGLKRLQAPILKTICPKNPLQQIAISITQSEDGSIWSGTAGGLLRFTGTNVIAYTARQGLKEDPIRCVREDKSHRLWIGYGQDGFSAFESDLSKSLWTTGQSSPGINGIFVCSDQEVIFTGHLGDRFLVYDHAKFQWSKDLFPHPTETLGFLETRRGERWVGSYGSGVLFHRLPDGPTEILAKKDGVPAPIIGPMFEDTSGAVWFATDRGIVRWKDRHFSWIQVADGLLEGITFNLLEDDFRFVWSNGRHGIYRYSKEQLDAFCDGKLKHFDGIAYGTADGMLTVEGDGPAFPSACKTREGEIWIPTTRGIVVVKPGQVRTATNLPPVMVEQVISNDHVVFGEESWREPSRVSQGGDSRIDLSPGGGRMVRIHYSVPSFRSPEQTIFEHRLDGLDKHWHEAGDSGRERFAYYTNLKPGAYTFRVRARNPGGTWSQPEGTAAFYIAPFFYQTGPFYALCAAALLSCGYGLHARRLRLQHQAQTFEHASVLERERTRIARDIHDSIGANLAKIQLLSQTAARKESPPREKLARITESARAAARDMDEIVWLLKPARHSPKSLIDFLSGYAAEFLEDAGIEFFEELPALPSDHELPVERCHNLFLAFKEAIANIAKHSGATQVRLHCCVTPGTMQIEIQDNGRGFQDPAPGNGLINMRQRMQQISGQFQITSAPGQGTTVRFAFPCSTT